MPIDPCLSGCQNHNIGANALPTAGDDACNTAGNGYFCAGSYWLVNAGVDGDCERLYLRTGGDCNVDQWIEISLGEVIADVVNPVDGADCCPPSTLWHNTVSGGLWMSYNYDGLCRWCAVCIPNNLEATALPTALDCATGGYAVGSIWRIPAGTLNVDQIADIVYHLVNDDPCQWCRICGGTSLSYGNNLVFEVMPNNVTFKPTVGVELFDTLGEFVVGTGTMTAINTGRYNVHMVTQVRTDIAVPFAIMEMGVRVNGAIAFWPVSQSFTNMAAGFPFNWSGTAHMVYLTAGDTLDVVIRALPFGSVPVLTIESFVVNVSDSAVH